MHALRITTTNNAHPQPHQKATSMPSFLLTHITLDHLALLMILLKCTKLNIYLYILYIFILYINLYIHFKLFLYYILHIYYKCIFYYICSNNIFFKKVVYTFEQYIYIYIHIHVHRFLKCINYNICIHT